MGNVSEAARSGGLRSLNNMNELTSMNVVNDLAQGGGSNNRSETSSSEERELFAIFSGLRVMTMTRGAPDAGASAAAAQRATTTTFEGDGTAQNADRPERPYRWLPAPLVMPPGTYH